jgi:hypothetical protein
MAQPVHAIVAPPGEVLLVTLEARPEFGDPGIQLPHFSALSLEVPRGVQEVGVHQSREQQAQKEFAVQRRAGCL